MKEKEAVKNDASLEEVIHKTFKEKCGKHPYHKMNCTLCRYADGEVVPDRDTCLCRYTIDIFEGKMKLTDSLLKEDLKPRLPAWCKVGAWVTREDPSRMLGVIKSVTDPHNDGLFVAWKKHPCVSGSIGPSEDFKPVRFRPYSFEEAKGLLGKVMEYNEDGILPAAAIIGMVSRDSSKVYYNGSSFEDLQDWDATIDGIPVGVPEIDEEALKGGGNESE